VTIELLYNYCCHLKIISFCFIYAFYSSVICFATLHTDYYDSVVHEYEINYSNTLFLHTYVHYKNNDKKQMRIQMFNPLQASLNSIPLTFVAIYK